MKVPFGKKIVDGEWKDIFAQVTETEQGLNIVGDSPFGGTSMSFLPLPEGFNGKYAIHRAKSLADIVDNEEKVIYRMGTVPTVYYEYKDGYCIGYYDKEEEEHN